MANEFELTDEQLEVVTGGGDSYDIFSPQNLGLGNLQFSVASAPTSNFSGFNFGDLYQTGASIEQKNKSEQTAEAW
jgi:hypothetical protein